MNTKSKARFLKLMALTASNNDHEALLALRNAQKILQTEKLSWEQILTPKTAYIEVQEPASKKPVFEVFDYAKIPKMPKNEDSKRFFNDIKKKFSLINGKQFEPETTRFLKSIHSHWMLKGTLSEKQLQCLTRICIKSNWK